MLHKLHNRVVLYIYNIQACMCQPSPIISSLSVLSIQPAYPCLSFYWDSLLFPLLHILYRLFVFLINSVSKMKPLFLGWSPPSRDCCCEPRTFISMCTLLCWASLRTIARWWHWTWRCAFRLPL